MARGRKALPDEVKAAKGNPGKRPLHLRRQPAEGPAVSQPAFLTDPDEIAIFNHVRDQLDQLRFIRATDESALGRWAAWLAQWARAKRDLGTDHGYYETTSKHGTMLRIHPLQSQMERVERLLLPLEDRLGLNVQARQMIVKGIFQAPPLRPNDPGEDDGLFRATEPNPPEDTPDSPLGFLNSAATRH